MITEARINEIKQHFGSNAFSGTQLATLLGTDPRGVGGTFKLLRRRGLVRQIKSGTYQFVNASTATTSAPATPEPTANNMVNELAPSAPVMARIGGYYLNPNAVLIADTLQAGKVVLHTAILEIDGETKHPRNKRLIFTKDHAPTEYRATLAWLESMAGSPNAVADETALQLAEEYERKLNEANKTIDELNRKLAAIRGAL